MRGANPHGSASAAIVRNSSDEFCICTHSFTTKCVERKLNVPGGFASWSTFQPGKNSSSPPVAINRARGSTERTARLVASVTAAMRSGEGYPIWKWPQSSLPSSQSSPPLRSPQWSSTYRTQSAACAGVPVPRFSAICGCAWINSQKRRNSSVPNVLYSGMPHEGLILETRLSCGPTPSCQSYADVKLPPKRTTGDSSSRAIFTSSGSMPSTASAGFSSTLSISARWSFASETTRSTGSSGATAPAFNVNVNGYFIHCVASVFTDALASTCSGCPCRRSVRLTAAGPRTSFTIRLPL